ncbi:hypothetical protein BB560_003432 [Smittium megazygosporum]|uniref:Uncharacterized protein n=1 Tax=Smittium megazygosporum TaxID=133381 RepID=A0A2T9ZC41_9FUNG|nr:hypothetical protein BB560_003432 [Smittium megazygosporum]
MRLSNSVFQKASNAVKAAAQGVAQPAGKKDLLKELYIKELRGLKKEPIPVKSDVSVKAFVEPKRPEGLKLDVEPEAALKSYSENCVV